MPNQYGTSEARRPSRTVMISTMSKATVLPVVRLLVHGVRSVDHNHNKSQQSPTVIPDAEGEISR